MGRGAALSGKRPRPVGCGLFAREGGAPREQLNWRSRMNALFKGFDQYGIGLLITVDEVSASLDEMISFAARSSTA